MYQHRAVERRPWDECASPVDTAEAAARLPVLAALYAEDPSRGAQQMAAHCRLTQDDGLTISLSVAFGCVLSALIRGEALDATISDTLMELVHDGVLPFGSVTARGNRPPGSDGVDISPIPAGKFPSPDGCCCPGTARRRRTIRPSASSRRGRCAACTGCRVRSTDPCRRRITWRRGSPGTSRARCCTRSTAADRTSTAPA